MGLVHALRCHWPLLKPLKRSTARLGGMAYIPFLLRGTALSDEILFVLASGCNCLGNPFLY